MGEIQNFLPRVNDYIEPTVIFIIWAKICSVKVKYFCNARVGGLAKLLFNENVWSYGIMFHVYSSLNSCCSPVRAVGVPWLWMCLLKLPTTLATSASLVRFPVPGGMPQPTPHLPTPLRY